jgi:uncharacterized protein YPO0396
MASMAREAWTDERLDDLNAKVDRLDQRMEGGFAEMREEFRAVRGEMRDEFRSLRGEIGAEFHGVRGEIAAMNRSFQQLTWGLIGAILVGFLSTAAAIVTQL